MSRNITRTASPSNSTATSPATSTMTVTTTLNLVAEEASSSQIPKVVTLKLKGKKERRSRHITWSEDTIDNENLNKKKSNCNTKNHFYKLFYSLVCCIFHPNEDEDHDCDHGKEYEEEEEQEIPAGKNVYEFQPKYKCNK